MIFTTNGICYLYILAAKLSQRGHDVDATSSRASTSERHYFDFMCLLGYDQNIFFNIIRNSTRCLIFFQMGSHGVIYNEEVIEESLQLDLAINFSLIAH